MTNIPGDRLRTLQREMKAALGDALDWWGNVEANLSAIFSAVVQSSDPDTASAAFSAIHSFEVQIAVTDAAIQHRFASDKKLLAAWKTLYKRLDAQRSIRNKLAHGKIIIGRKAGVGYAVRFLPFFNYATHKDRATAFLHFDQKQIDAIRDGFRELTERLHEFGKPLGAVSFRERDWQL